MRSHFARCARLIFAGAALFSLAACASSGSEVSASGVYDPFEPVNRSFFVLNDALDTGVIVPIAKGYRAVTIKPTRQGVRNFLENAQTPTIFANDVLQLEGERAGVTLSRFLINTTIGFFGFFDPAERLGLPRHSEDFGQTLASYNVPGGPYIYLPVFGPGNIRDHSGRFVDLLIDPITWWNDPPGRQARFGVTGSSIVAFREPLIEPLAEIKGSSLDYYASIRSLYSQSRAREIRNGASQLDDIPEFEDFGDFDDFDDFDEFDDFESDDAAAGAASN